MAHRASGQGAHLLALAEPHAILGGWTASSYNLGGGLHLSPVCALPTHTLPPMCLRMFHCPQFESIWVPGHAFNRVCPNPQSQATGHLCALMGLQPLSQSQGHRSQHSLRLFWVTLPPVQGHPLKTGASGASLDSMLGSMLWNEHWHLEAGNVSSGSSFPCNAG